MGYSLHRPQRTRQQRSQSLLDQFPHIQHIADDRALYALAQQYLTWLRVHNYSERTVEGREVQLCELIDWLAQRQLFYPTHVSKQMLDRYQRTLFYRRKANGQPLSFESQCGRLTTIRVWFKWLMQQDYITSNPASELQSPRRHKRLPKAILSEREVERVLHQPDTHTAIGLRDRAILEVFYSTGIRRTELANVNIVDIDRAEHTLMVRQGKNKKDRLIPIGERATAWVEKYLYEARGELSCARDHGELFLSAFGYGMQANSLGPMVRRYIEQAGITKAGSCHLFRHAMATLMLENGADIRYIQAMLGHADITATQIYTQVSVKKLQEIYTRTHPAANLIKKEKASDVELVSVEESEEALLAMLETEAHDDTDS